MAQVKIPNGQVVRFPDDMSSEDMGSAIDSIMKQDSPTENENPFTSGIPLIKNKNPFVSGIPIMQNAIKPDIDKTKNRIKGLAQGAENVGIGYANLLPGVNINKAKWAGNNPDVNSGELAANLGSYLLPGAAFKAGNILQKINNPLLKLGKAGIENSLAEAASSNKEDQGQAAARGGAVGAGANAISQLARAKNPIINALLRGSLGAAGGLGANALTKNDHPYTAALSGASLGIGLPYTFNKLGIAAAPAGLETLSHLNQAESQPAFEAGQRLGTNITPSEASGNPAIGAIEGEYGRGGDAAAFKTSVGQERVRNQQTAINDLLDTIYDKSTPAEATASKQKIQDLYNQANKWSLKPDVVSNMQSDPVIKQAFDTVKSDPAYQRKLIGIAENNYAYLNQVKRALADKEGSAMRAGEKDRASEYADARHDLVNKMDASVPAYKQAREEAQKSIIRSNLQKLMQKKELKGSTFYNTILKNDDQFNKLHDSLKNVPEAQDKLKDMKLAWKNLIDIEKPKNAAFRSETGLSQSRNAFSQILDMYNHMTGSGRNIQALKFIHSPEWDKGFAKIQEIQNTSKRRDAIAEMLSKVSSIGILQGSK